MAGCLNVAVAPNAGLPFHVVLPSIALRSRKDALPDFPHQAGHHHIFSISGSTVSFVGSLNLPGATPGITPSNGRVQSIVVHPSGTRAYVYQAVAGNVEVLTIDSSNNVADSGIGIPFSINGSFLGVELIATDGNSVFVSDGAGISAIDVVTNQVTGSTAAVGLTGIAVQGTLPPPNLSGANLKGTNLAGANLSDANLKGANLSGANLQGADLAGANLQGANLKGANLTSSGLAGANLKGANLSRANLTSSDLAGANLQGANVNGVTWANTVCPDGTNSNADGQTCKGHF